MCMKIPSLILSLIKANRLRWIWNIAVSIFAHFQLSWLCPAPLGSFDWLVVSPAPGVRIPGKFPALMNANGGPPTRRLIVSEIFKPVFSHLLFGQGCDFRCHYDAILARYEPKNKRATCDATLWSISWFLINSDVTNRIILASNCAGKLQKTTTKIWGKFPQLHFPFKIRLAF